MGTFEIIAIAGFVLFFVIVMLAIILPVITSESVKKTREYQKKKNQHLKEVCSETTYAKITESEPSCSDSDGRRRFWYTYTYKVNNKEYSFRREEFHHSGILNDFIKHKIWYNPLYPEDYYTDTSVKETLKRFILEITIMILFLAITVGLLFLMFSIIRKLFY